ncbi:MAG: hypothetical protein H0V82_03440 [Candidatus Protochlamydia sp.]|nr:hypothetical protein [Candidatus Protochlamydia sp.]
MNTDLNIAYQLITHTTQNIQERAITQNTINENINLIFNQLETIPFLETLHGDLQTMLELCAKHKLI